MNPIGSSHRVEHGMLVYRGLPSLDLRSPRELTPQNPTQRTSKNFNSFAVPPSLKASGTFPVRAFAMLEKIKTPTLLGEGQAVVRRSSRDGD